MLKLMPEMDISYSSYLKLMYNMENNIFGENFWSAILNFLNIGQMVKSIPEMEISYSSYLKLMYNMEK